MLPQLSIFGLGPFWRRRMNKFAGFIGPYIFYPGRASLSSPTKELREMSGKINHYVRTRGLRLFMQFILRSKPQGCVVLVHVVVVVFRIPFQ